ncbi:RfaL Lipid A core - O-antigen ligase and related enzymes [Candidatus Nanopelagicaceae bacterium]
MLNKNAEKTIAKYFLIGAPVIALFLLTTNVSDPVNVTKLFALGGLAGAVGAITLIQRFRLLWDGSKVLVVSAFCLVLFSIVSIIGSSGPISQNLYGVYGRNTGLVTYFLLVLISIAAASLREHRTFEWLLYGLFFAGVVNVIYCGWVLLFGDFVGWTNPYGNILGTFGNPDFISAFLGIFIAASTAWALGTGRKLVFRLAVLAINLMAAYEIHKSHAIQGKVVAIGGLVVVAFFYLRSITKGWLSQGAYLTAVGVAGFFAVAGALQIGPLTKYIYKTSVSLRGEYWAAAFRTGEKHPFNGVGMDIFGDWYRRTRDAQAMILPGPNTVTNVAHNVVLDFFASGGWPLLLSYLALIVLGALAIVRVARRNRSYDPIFVAMAAGWICYQAQSIISINQIGLALWGWIFTGALIGYEVATRTQVGEESSAPSKKRGKATNSVVSSSLIAGLGLVVGLIIAVPPLSSDMAWTSALRSQNLATVEAALVPTYLHPQNSMRYAQIVQSLEQSKLPDIAHKYALIGVEFNPDYFEAWKSLYFATNATAEEKSRALENLKRLDPLNTDVTK